MKHNCGDPDENKSSKCDGRELIYIRMFHAVSSANGNLRHYLRKDFLLETDDEA
jgi:hypothetical protein